MGFSSSLRQVSCQNAAKLEDPNLDFEFRWGEGGSGRRCDLRTSGDTAGPRDQVVGYGAFVFEEQAK